MDTIYLEGNVIWTIFLMETESHKTVLGTITIFDLYEFPIFKNYERDVAAYHVTEKTNAPINSNRHNVFYMYFLTTSQAWVGSTNVYTITISTIINKLSLIKYDNT